MWFAISKNINLDSLIFSTNNGSNIERVTECTEYLGIWIDEKLTFKYHVSKLVTSLRMKEKGLP